MAARLNTAALAGLPADIARPGYDRSRLRPGIVHLGIGAFHRAHQAPVNDRALAASSDLRWGIVGVSLRSAATRDALAPQDGLYTLALRDADQAGLPRESLSVVGSVLRVEVAPEAPHAVLAQIAHPCTRIVSLTVTEKGYCHLPSSGRLRADDPDIVHDLSHADAPRSVPGMVVRGLARRRAAGLGPLTLLSCDNLPSNGNTLRALVLEFADAVDSSLRAWIEAHCAFPNSMVDRIVPRTTDDDKQRVAQRLGVRDAWPVVGEPFMQWVVEDRFAAGRPAWDASEAVRFVSDAAPYEHVKLRMVNGPHSALAYLGVVAGLETISDAMRVPVLRDYIEALIQHEIAPTLPALPGADLAAMRTRLLARFANPALPHRNQQVAMDGSQKLPQRLLATVRDRMRSGAGHARLALAVAAWAHYLRGHDELGRAYSIQDPLCRELQALISEAGQGLDAERRRVRALVGYRPVFGDLGGHSEFVDAVARHAMALRQRGVLAAVCEAI